MARTVTQWALEIREYVQKGKLKAARKTLEKAQKSGVAGPILDDVMLELLLAEGGGPLAAERLAAAARGEGRPVAAAKLAEAHLKGKPDDHAVRDALWEMALAMDAPAVAVQHLGALVAAGAIDGTARAKDLLARKDVPGATGIFLLATLGAVKTDRMKLADRLLAGPQGAQLLGAAAQALLDAGKADGPVHYVLAQLAQKEGNRERFLQFAGKAFGENPEEVWTWTSENVGARDRLEIALHNDSLRHLLQAAKGAAADDIVDVAKRSGSEGISAKVLRGLALLLTDKAPNACRILEGAVTEQAAAAGPVSSLLAEKTPSWRGAAEVRAAVVATALRESPEEVQGAIGGLLLVPPAQRGEAWGRAAPRLLDRAPERDDLRLELGLFLLRQKDLDGAAALLKAGAHVPLAKAWAEAGLAKGPVLLAAARLAESDSSLAEHAEWLLRAGREDAALMGELGKIISAATVAPETAIGGASALLKEGQRDDAAGLLSRLPLDPATGKRVDEFLAGQRLHDDRAFLPVAFRCSLALGDAPRARRLFRTVTTNMQLLAREAARYADAGRVLADVLIGHEKGEVAVTILEALREAGDDAKTLLPLADALLKASPRLAMGRLLRGRLLLALGRHADGVRDLRAIPANAAEVDEAFRLLGEAGKTDSAADAALGRADTHIARKEWKKAVQELMGSGAPAQERLDRFTAICREKGDLEAAHKGRAIALLDLGRVPDAAEAHLKRFGCPDAERAAVAADLEDVAGAALKSGDLPTTSSILGQIPDQVSDGAERAIRVIGADRRPQMLVLRSQLLLQLQRTSEAVATLVDLVRGDATARPQAAQALEAIVDSGQARPEADLALAQAFDAMERTPDALRALKRLYEDDITGRETVVAAAEKLVVRGDDPHVRLFLAGVCLDMRNPAGATQHAIYARRLQPAARRDCVELLRRALDLDAFAPDTHFALAEAHLAGDEADDAVRHFRAAVEVDRERARPAIAAMEEAAPRSKHPALLWLAVGTTYAEFQKDHARAVEAFTKGLKANPTMELKVPLLLGRGDSYAALREDDKAFDDFDEASRHDLLERRYYEFLRSRHRKRVLETARAAATKATKEFPHAVEAVGRYLTLGQAQEAVDVAQAALSESPNDLGARYLVGVALHAAGRYDAAAQVLEKVRGAAGPETAVGRAARMLLAASHLDSGDRARARACLTEIEAVDAAYPGLAARRAALAPPADDPHAPPPLFVRPEFPRPTG
jgi:tetratricopeptide (TPR) repeat protein